MLELAKLAGLVLPKLHVKCFKIFSKRNSWIICGFRRFFPFADGLENLIQAGVKSIIQPGGSIRDQEVIDAADKAGISMVFTGIRNFKH